MCPLCSRAFRESCGYHEIRESGLTYDSQKRPTCPVDHGYLYLASSKLGNLSWVCANSNCDHSEPAQDLRQSNFSQRVRKMA